MVTLSISFQTFAFPGGAVKAGSGQGDCGAAPPPAVAQLMYSIAFHGRPLIESSPTQVDLEGARPRGSDLKIVGSVPSSADEMKRSI
jgi:hypothetical protein